MQIGIISDIHANRVALDAVLEDMPPVDELVCAGDLVGYNPWPATVLETIRDLDVPCIQGNHDRMVASDQNFRGNRMAREGVSYAREELSSAQLSYLESLPIERTRFDGQVKIVHGHPDDPDRYTYPDAFGADLLGDESVLVIGHTHVQHVEETGNGIVLNPGSVGQPRDGNPDAAYALLDLDTMTVKPQRVSYDISRVERAVAEADLPFRTAERLRDGR